MCGPAGTRCIGGQTCGIGNPFTVCEPSPTGCTNCHYSLMTTDEEMVQDAVTKQWTPPEGALRGYVVPGLGYVLKGVGKSQFQPGDVILTVAKKGERPEPVNSAWFSQHWEDMQLPKEQQPKEFEVTYYRPGSRALSTVTLTRA